MSFVALRVRECSDRHLPALRAGRFDNTGRGGGVVLTITKLSNAEYVLGQVAAGIEDLYVGSGEAPGVWQGAWAKELGLDGAVRADPQIGLHIEHQPARAFVALDRLL